MISEIIIGYESFRKEDLSLCITGDNIEEAKEYVKGIDKSEFSCCVFRDYSNTAYVEYREI